MRVLAVSHSCVIDVNQQVFVALGQIPGVRIELVVPGNWKNEYSGERQIPSLLPSVNFPVHRLPIAAPGHVSLHFYLQGFPVRRLRQFRPDIVLSAQEPWSLSGLQAAWLSRKLNAPFVFQTNQNILKRYPPPFSWIEAYSYRTAKMALAYSEEARQVLLRKGFRKPSAVLSYATDISMFLPGKSPTLREQLGLRGCVVIGYMGRFVPEKGLDTLVEAVKLLRAKDALVRVKVLMVGAGPDEERLRRLVHTAGLDETFVWTGVVPHLKAGEYMGCIDVFALPSRTMPNWKEQFGRVIIEALACQVPVVGSDSGQIPQLIEMTGGGLIFREGDAVDLREKLLGLLRDPERRRSLGWAGHAAVHRSYTCEAVATRLHKLLETAMPEEVKYTP